MLAFKARGRVVVGILDQEQEAARSSGESTTSTSPWCNCVAAERVTRGGAHDDKRRPLQSQRHTHAVSNTQRLAAPAHLIVAALMERRVAAAVPAPRVEQAVAFAW